MRRWWWTKGTQWTSWTSKLGKLYIVIVFILSISFFGLNPKDIEMFSHNTLFTSLVCAQERKKGKDRLLEHKTLQLRLFVDSFGKTKEKEICRFFSFFFLAITDGISKKVQPIWMFGIINTKPDKISTCILTSTSYSAKTIHFIWKCIFKGNR